MAFEFLEEHSWEIIFALIFAIIIAVLYALLKRQYGARLQRIWYSMKRPFSRGREILEGEVENSVDSLLPQVDKASAVFAIRTHKALTTV